MSSCTVAKGVECSLAPPPSGVVTFVTCNGATLVVCSFSGIYLYDTQVEPFIQVAHRSEAQLRQAYRAATCQKRNGVFSRYIAVAAGTSRAADGHTVSVVSPGYSFIVGHGDHGAHRVTSLILWETNEGRFIAVSGDADGGIVLLDVTRGTSHRLFAGTGQRVCGLALINRTSDGFSLVVSSIDSVFLHQISSTWQAEKSVPVLLQQGFEAPLCNLGSVAAIGKELHVLAVDENGADSNTLKLDSHLLGNHCLINLHPVARIDERSSIVAQSENGDVFLFVADGPNSVLHARQYVFCVSKFRKERHADKDQSPRSLALGFGPGESSTPVVFLALNDGRTLLYVPLESATEFTLSSSPKMQRRQPSVDADSSPTRSRFIDAMSFTVNKLASKTTTVIDTFTSQPLTKAFAQSIVGAVDEPIEGSDIRSDPEMGVQENAGEELDHSEGSQPSFSSKPIVVHSVDRRRKLKVKKVLKRKPTPEEGSDDALQYARDQSAQLSRERSIQSDAIAVDEKLAAETLKAQRALDSLLDVEEPASRNNLSFNEKSLFADIFAQHMRVLEMWERLNIRPRAIKPLRAASHLRHVVLALPHVSMTAHFTSAEKNVALPTATQISDADFIANVRRRQAADARAFEVAELRLQQEAELATMVDVEEFMAEENERKDPNVGWVPFKMRFQLPEDGSEIDLNRLDAMQSGEWAWCDNEPLAESVCCSGFPLWRTGVWKYARVWPSVEPSPDSHWTPEYQLLSDDGMRVRRRCVFRKQRMLQVHKKKEELRMQHAAQLAKLSDKVAE